MLVELKNGETLNGHLVTCDTWMNLTLKEVVQTSPVSAPFLSHLDEELCLHYESDQSDVVRKRVANVQLFQEGDRFFRLPEVYVKGNNVCLLFSIS
jgi:U6 snRNA-associated Sm-like protein LSm4